MSVVFVVGSEDQLRLGTPWCKRFCDSTHMPVHVLVIGQESRVLQRHAQTTLSNHLEIPLDKLSISVVEKNADAVLQAVKSAGGRYLLMLRNAHDDAMQQEIFEHSPIWTIWLRTSEIPPTQREHVFCGLAQTQSIATSAAEQLLGLIPSKVVVTESLNSQDATSDDAASSSPSISANEIAQGVEQIVAGDYDEHDLLVVGVEDPVPDDSAHRFGLGLIHSQTTASVAMVSDGDSIRQSLHRSLNERIQTWVASVAPPMEREERVALVDNLVLGSKPNLEFLGLISASSMLAAFGLLQDSAAVIIGAMLIAPLMTPILGAGLSLAHGNRPLFKTSLMTISLGFVGALGASILFGLLVIMVRPTSHNHLDWITPEMWSRCRPSPLDFCVGLVGGMAASYAQTRRHLSAALAGAAIAAALVPPLSTAGLQIAFGIWGDLDSQLVPPGVLPVIGPLLLVSVNVLTIMVGASFVLWARG
ncbi:MAG: DUF389 domain-containing protein, partial [Pirellulaceae bacterium]|nr:DUF389 domain-containing protein [Pirellulaceae bacterium]